LRTRSTVSRMETANSRRLQKGGRDGSDDRGECRGAPTGGR
jgi:hypothetical protein